jgi:Holliday junction resolvasome RuvABC endonuclease subunit
MGIDPGLSNIGVAIYDTDSKELIYLKTITTKPKDGYEVERFRMNKREIRRLIKKYNVDFAVLEKLDGGRANIIKYQFMVIESLHGKVDYIGYTPHEIKKTVLRKIKKTRDKPKKQVYNYIIRKFKLIDRKCNELDIKVPKDKKELEKIRKKIKDHETDAISIFMAHLIKEGFDV